MLQVAHIFMVRYSLMLSIPNEMILIFLVQPKGGLISESFSLWLKSQKKGYPPKEKMLKIVMWLLFWRIELK